MMKRLLLAIALLIGLSAPAYAQELNADTNCTNAGAWTAGTGWAAGSGCVGSSVSAMKMLMQMISGVKAGHRYKLTFTVGGYSAGQLRGFVGLTMPSSTPGSWITAASVSDVADNFTTANGLTTGNHHPVGGPGDSSEANGAWRFFCSSAGLGKTDPIVYNGKQSPHWHEFYGASNVGKSWTFNDFRTKAQSSCSGGRTAAKYGVNRSGYWFPGIFDGVGNAKRAALILVYYKAAASPSTPASATFTGSITGTTLTVTSVTGSPIGQGMFINGAGITANTPITAYGTGIGGTGTYTVGNSLTVGSETITLTSPYTGPASDVSGLCAAQSYSGCANVPTGLRMTFGYRSSDGYCGPTDTTNLGTGPTGNVEGCSLRNAVGYSCDGGPNNEGAAKGTQYTSEYNNIQDLWASGTPCVVGSWLHFALNFPTCWDNVNVDSPNHRDHITFGNANLNCLNPLHPIKLPSISIQAYYRIDAAFVAHKWHLSSDEMATSCAGGAVVPFCTAHGDYFEAWSPTIRTTWYNNCILNHNSCTNELGDGTAVIQGAQNFDGTDIPGNGLQSAAMNDKTPFQKLGMTPDITANGTYTYYLDSPDDMAWGFMGLGGFSGTITNIHLTDVGVTAKGPVTVHN